MTWLATAWGRLRGVLLGLLVVASAFLGFGAWYYRREAKRETMRAEMNRRLAKLFADRTKAAEQAADERARVLEERDRELSEHREAREKAEADAAEARRRFDMLDAQAKWESAFRGKEGGL